MVIIDIIYITIISEPEHISWKFPNTLNVTEIIQK